MMVLRELQLSLQEHLLHGTAAFASSVLQTGGLDATARLAIYVKAHRLRLTAALREGYPALAHVLGPPAFDELARTYIDAQPSRQASIRWFGAQLAAHLQAHGRNDLVDLARWEWTLGTVFDGPDAEAVGLDAATSIAAQDWPDLRIDFCRNLQCIAVRADAVQAWRAATSGAADSPTDPLVTTAAWLVWRRDLVTTFRSLSPDEAWALDAARSGATFSELCEGLASRAGVDHAAALAASLLQQWLTEGCIAALTCEPG